MGKVIEMVRKLRRMGHAELINRFKHIARAQAVREYLAAKEDKDLSLEVNLASEEVISRMSKANAVHIQDD